MKDNIIRIRRRVELVRVGDQPFAAYIEPACGSIVTANGLNGERFTSLDGGKTWRLVSYTKPEVTQ